MPGPRRYLVASLVLGAFALVAACGGSDEDVTGDEGAGGEASGASGAGAAGGSAAGKGGASAAGKGGGGSGASGTSGAGGKGGAGGASGQAGQAGAGGQAGFPGAGGGGSAAAGGGGKAGTAGAAGLGGTAGQAGQAGAGQAGAASCLPTQKASTDGGGQCAGLSQAWTARGINVGYYAFKVTKEIAQYSGDYGGDPAAIFTAGGATKGVILQKVPVGAYVGLSSTGPNYTPEGQCFPSGSCGLDESACTNDSPPMRPSLGPAPGYVWGYAYQGGSHMQGWFPYDPASLQFAGFDAAHPCARGPAGVDYEVHAACGKPTACAGGNISCGQANRCNEGADDCGATSCGAMSGGPLTPSAWKRTVKAPTGVHACAKAVPHPSVKCFANGSDPDFFFVYPFGAYLYWAQNSTTKHWLHYGDQVQVYFHTRDAQGVLWDFVEVLQTGAPALTPKSDGAGAPASCTSADPSTCTPCKNGGTCGWVQDVFLP